jgi:hypothetical protein
VSFDGQFSSPGREPIAEDLNLPIRAGELRDVELSLRLLKRILHGHC